MEAAVGGLAATQQARTHLQVGTSSAAWPAPPGRACCSSAALLLVQQKSVAAPLLQLLQGSTQAGSLGVGAASDPATGATAQLRLLSRHLISSCCRCRSRCLLLRGELAAACVLPACLLYVCVLPQLPSRLLGLCVGAAIGPNPGGPQNSSFCAPNFSPALPVAAGRTPAAAVPARQNEQAAVSSSLQQRRGSGSRQWSEQA